MVETYDLRAYIGAFLRDDKTMVIANLDNARLVLTIWNSAHVPYEVRPSNSLTTKLTGNLFDAATCWPMPGGSGASDRASNIHFEQDGGQITGFTWDDPQNTKIGQKSTFTRTTDPTLASLAEPKAALLLLPAEIRNKIYGYIFNDERITVIAYGNKARLCVTENGKASRPKDAIVDVCRQLRQETKGIFLWNTQVSTDLDNFSRLINVNDPLVIGRLNRISILSGFRGLFKEQNFAEKIHPIIDFCFKHPHIEVRIRLGDWRYYPVNPGAFTRMGMVIDHAIRGYTRCRWKQDLALVGAWRGDRTVAQLDAPNLRILEARGHKFEGTVKFKKRVVTLIKQGDIRMKEVIDVY